MNIFRSGALALIALASAALLSTAAEARWAPSGSYQATCRGVHFDGDLLTATCQRRDGSWHNTYMSNADDCDSGIVNNNGQLECGWSDWHDRRGRDARDYDAPRGSYESTCTDARMDGYTLKATCQRRDGSWRWTSLEDAYDCDGRISNDNGRLVCWRR